MQVFIFFQTLNVSPKVMLTTIFSRMKLFLINLQATALLFSSKIIVSVACKCIKTNQSNYSYSTTSVQIRRLQVVGERPGVEESADNYSPQCLLFSESQEERTLLEPGGGFWGRRSTDVPRQWGWQIYQHYYFHQARVETVEGEMMIIFHKNID